ncbi:MAG: hypothetical protein IJU03_00120 [Thermoguttaceae bacterium]|nr:hypothetical protein [Thermoguttaceae bacterium]
MSDIKFLSRCVTSMERQIIYEVDGEKKIARAPVSVKTFDQLEAQIKAEYATKQAPKVETKVETKKPTPQEQPAQPKVAQASTPNVKTHATAPIKNSAAKGYAKQETAKKDN